MIYSAAGALLAAAIALLAWRRSLGAPGYYDGMVYGMDARSHRRYCAISIAFAVCFTLMCVLHWTAAGIVALTAYAIVAVFYAASFLRGASDDVA